VGDDMYPKRTAPENADGSHCSHCGRAFPLDAKWPRPCANCENTSYRNPVPVAAVLLPVNGGLLTVRRTIQPGDGQWTFPDGFLNYGESWKAVAQELLEETGICLANPGEPEVLYVSSTSRGHMVIIFALARPRRLANLPPFQPTAEVEKSVSDRPRRLVSLADAYDNLCDSLAGQRPLEKPLDRTCRALLLRRNEPCRPMRRTKTGTAAGNSRRRREYSALRRQHRSIASTGLNNGRN